MVYPKGYSHTTAKLIITSNVPNKGRSLASALRSMVSGVNAKRVVLHESKVSVVSTGTDHLRFALQAQASKPKSGGSIRFGLAIAIGKDDWVRNLFLATKKSRDFKALAGCLQRILLGTHLATRNAGSASTGSTVPHSMASMGPGGPGDTLTDRPGAGGPAKSTWTSSSRGMHGPSSFATARTSARLKHVRFSLGFGMRYRTPCVFVVAPAV